MKIPLPQFVSRLRIVTRIGEDIMRTHRHLGELNNNPAAKTKHVEGLQRIQEDRIKDFTDTLDHALNDWDAKALHKYWTGY
jgi:hypothetical protein